MAGLQSAVISKQGAKNCLEVHDRARFCNVCGGTIPKEEKHLRYSGGGGFQKWKVNICRTCLDVLSREVRR